MAVTGSRERNKSIKGFERRCRAVDDANPNRCAADEVRGNYLFTYNIVPEQRAFNAFALPSHPPPTDSLLSYVRPIYDVLCHTYYEYPSRSPLISIKNKKICTGARDEHAVHAPRTSLKGFCSGRISPPPSPPPHNPADVSFFSPLRPRPLSLGCRFRIFFVSDAPRALLTVNTMYNTLYNIIHCAAAYICGHSNIIHLTYFLYYKSQCYFTGSYTCVRFYIQIIYL